MNSQMHRPFAPVSRHRKAVWITTAHQSGWTNVIWSKVNNSYMGDHADSSQVSVLIPEPDWERMNAEFVASKKSK